MFGEYYAELLSLFFTFTLLSNVKCEEQVRADIPPQLQEMSLSLLKNIFYGSYVPISMKPATQFSEKPFDLESTGSDISNTSTLAGNEKLSFKVDSRLVSDAIIRRSDDLTVPFALTAGLSALADTKVVIYGGLAEPIAGAISMDLEGYLGAKCEEDPYHATRKQPRDQIANNPDSISGSISAIFEPYGLPEPLTTDLTGCLEICTSEKMVDFVMSFEHVLREPASSGAITCALTIALGYFVGGFVPLLPYFFAGNITEA